MQTKREKNNLFQCCPNGWCSHPGSLAALLLSWEGREAEPSTVVLPPPGNRQVNLSKLLLPITAEVAHFYFNPLHCPMAHCLGGERDLLLRLSSGVGYSASVSLTSAPPPQPLLLQGFCQHYLVGWGVTAEPKPLSNTLSRARLCVA